MSSDGKTVLPHAGTPSRGNPVVGSYRVQAPVAGAGSKDCGGSQTSLSEEESRGLAAEVATEIEKHRDLLNKLRDFAQPKINVHKDIKAMIATLVSGFTKLRRELAKQSKRPEVAEGGTQTTPALTRQTEVADMEVEETPKTRRVARGKRRKEQHTPQSAEQQEKKRKQQEEQPRTDASEEAGDGASQEKWQKAKGKKKKKKEPRKETQPKATQQPRKQRGRPTLPNALIVEKKTSEGMSYAEILSHIRKSDELKDVSTAVQKVRRTNAGSLLFVLTKESSEKAPELHQALQKALGENASVKSKVQELDVEFKDMDEVTTKEEVVDAIQRDLGNDGGITLSSVRSLRPAYNKTQTAVVRLLAPTAKKLLEQKSVRIGWTYCRIRELVRPMKCYKCWNFGHLSRNCSSEVDRSKCCIKCGKEGHKVAECKADACCALCAAEGGEKPDNHVAGSSRCPTYARALQATAKRR